MRKSNTRFSLVCVVLALIGLPVVQVVKTCHQVKRAVTSAQANRAVHFTETSNTNFANATDMVPVRCHSLGCSGVQGDLTSSSTGLALTFEPTFALLQMSETLMLSQQHAVPFRPPSA